MYELTGFQRDLLAIVAGSDEPHGLAVKEVADEYYTKEINHGRLYPNLDTLVEYGMVEKYERDRRTNEYALTDKGRRVLEERREWEDEVLGILDEDEDESVTFA